MSVLIINDVPIECIDRAAIAYHVPPRLIISVLKTENGRNGMANRNSNGTVDLGSMQINSLWLKKIAPYGYTQQAVQDNPCVNVTVGTWILSQNLTQNHYWQGVGDYHSHTPQFNQVYRQKVSRKFNDIGRLLAVT